MLDIVVESAGFIAAATTILLFAPQAFTAYKNRNDPHAFRALSASTFWLGLVGQLMWLVYGLGIGAMWTAVPSVVSAPLTAFILVLIYRARRTAARTHAALDSTESVADHTPA